MKKMLQKILVLVLYGCSMFTALADDNLIRIVRRIPGYENVPFALLMPALAVARCIIAQETKKTKPQPRPQPAPSIQEEFPKQSFECALVGGAAP